MKINRPNEIQLGPSPVRPAQQPQEIDLRKYWYIFRRRWLVMASVALIVLVAVALFTFLQPKIYEGTAKVVVAQSKNTSASDILSDGGLMVEASSTATQVEIINSPQLIRGAFLQMSEEERRKGFGQTDLPPVWSYTIGSMKDTNIVLITGRALNPQAAADFANKISRAYLDQDRDQSQQASREGRLFVEAELKTKRDELAAASVALAHFKEKTNLMIPSVQVSNLATTSAQLQADLSTARSDAVSANERLSQLDRDLRRSSPEVQGMQTVATNPEYSLVQQHIVDLQNQLSQAEQTYTKDAPETVAISKQLALAQGRLKSLYQTTVQSVTKTRNPAIDKLVGDYSDAKGLKIAADSKVAALGQQYDLIKQQLRQYPESEFHYAQLQAQVDALTDAVKTLNDRFFQLQIDEKSTVSSGQIAAAAEPKIVPASPKVLINMLVGLLLAVIMSVFVGLVSDMLDNRVRRPEELEKELGLPLLTLVPEAKSTGSSERLHLGEVDPAHAFMEAFRMLRNNVAFMAPDRNHVCVAVTSASMGEGKSTVSANLAIATAMDRKRVLIIDVDLRRPSVHELMNTGREQGFSTVVRGLSTLQDAIQPTQWKGLDCLAAGPLPPDPTEFLNSDASRQVIEQAREMYDVVILDAPPCVGLSDMQVIGPMSDGVLLVVALDSAPKPMIHAAVRFLEQSAARVLGVAVNRMGRGGSAYGYYGYYGYYSYHADTDSSATNGHATNGHARKGRKRGATSGKS